MRFTFPKFLIVAMCGLCAASSGQAATSAPSLELEVMTFNLRYASERPPNAWPDRRPAVAAVIAESAPDIFGTQEGVWQQIQNIAEDRPEYDWVGLGRDGGSRGEFCAIYFLRERFELVAFDHFWLSDTPEIIASITWGHKHKRMATWGHFRDRDTQREFIVLNTHFDHRIEVARQKSARLIRERIKQFEPDIPLIVMGDFNCPADASEPFDILTTETGLVDTWTHAKTCHPTPTPNTFGGYEPPKFEGKRIDWVLARNPTTISRARIVTTEINGQYPSDHYPVTATLIFD
ncbi:MAG: endonuclease/exonuclease/phosphatase family protein [Verrucomicrobiia bacterium]